MHSRVRDLLVIETAGVLAGPLVGQFFAELGARVIKVENPGAGGDVTRSWRTAAESPNEPCPAYFCAANWGKSSIALDLGDAAERGVLLDLLDRADIWIDNFRPAALERLGIDPGAIRERNPRLIHARISAYGEGDERPGYDAALQAETGLMSINGTAQSGPLKLPLAMVDILAAHQLKAGVLLALWERDQSGAGAGISVSLYDSGVSSLANQAANFLVTGQAPRRLGSGHPNIVPYGTVFECAEGKPVVLAVGDDRQFSALCAVLGRQDLARQSEYAGNQDRLRNREPLEALLAELIAATDRDELLAGLRQSKVPAAPVLSLEEVIESRATAPLLLRDDPSGRAGLRTAIFQRAEPGSKPVKLCRPPRLNQDAAEILTGVLGYPPDHMEGILRRASAGPEPGADDP